MQSTEKPVTPRFDTVDLLRGLSILAVVVLHTDIRMTGAGFPLPKPAPWWLNRLVFNGGNGVTVFFAISGFLITYTSIKRFGGLAKMRPAAFYRIRFARIAPTLLLLLALLSVLHLTHVEGFRINLKRETLPGALFAALTFHLNWYEAVHGYLPANWDVLWSLSVEEMFYLFFPLICVVAFRWKRGLWVFVGVLLTFIALGPFGRTVWAVDEIAAEKSYLGGMNAIALGCLTGLILAWAGRHFSRRALLAAQAVGWILIAWIAVWPRWQWIRPIERFLAKSDLDDTVLPIGVCLVIFGSVLLARPGFKWTGPIRWFGRHSYEVYLTHEFLVIAGTELHAKFRGGPLALWFAGILVCTAPLGWAVARFFSEPMNRRLREHNGSNKRLYPGG